MRCRFAALLILLVPLVTEVAFADSTLTVLPKQQSVQVFEGQKGEFTFIVKNTTGDDVNLKGFSADGVLGKTDFDATDRPKAETEGLHNLTGTCFDGGVLVFQETCTLVFKFTTDLDGEETPADRGNTRLTVDLGNGFIGKGIGNIKVKDIGFVATPEPSSLLLFGTGLVGLVPVIRRKLRV